MPTLQVTVDVLTPAQQVIFQRPARFVVLDCGRRFGKTSLGKRLAVEYMIRQGKPVAYFGPTYKNVAEFWRTLKSTMQPVQADRSEQEKYLRVVTGGTLECWSLDTLESLRGRKYALAIIDEAALVRDADYFDAIIRPTLADYRGGALFLSTPRGRNHFWRMYQQGVQKFDGEWASFQFPTSANPHIDPAEIESARRQIPDRLFRQEYLAEFLDDGGGVFRGVRECVAGEMRDDPQHGRAYVIGVDLAKQSDYTVMAVMDVEAQALVWYERFNQIDYTLQLARLGALAQRYAPQSIVIERNTGEMFIEQAQRQGLPVVAFQTTASSKQMLIDSLALAFEQRAIRIPNDETLIGELEAYEMERLPGGTFRYSAPDGQHDDTVMATALARHGTINRRGSVAVIEWW